MRGKRILAGLILAVMGAVTMFGGAALADGTAGETATPAEPVESGDLVPVATVDETSPPAAEPESTDSGDESDEAGSDDRGDREARPRPAPHHRPGGHTRAAGTADQPPPEDGQGTVEIDPESAAGMCPGGTALKIDNLRSNGTFGPITISDFTNTSFTWSSTEGVTAVLVKDGGGHKTNPGGSSGFASTFGQDISHVIFCLGGEVPDSGTAPEEPCDADATMPGTQPCEPPCDGDDTMPGTQPCAPPLCDADETMPGRQDCTAAVGDVESKPEKDPADTDVQGAGLSADRAPEVAPMAAQPVAQGATLPFTGGELLGFVTIAAGLVTAGSGAVLIRRP